MKMTLLDIVQDILNDLDSDEVNSIDDTIESMQVAQIVKTTYYAMMSNRNWPHLRKLIQTTNTSSSSRPTHLILPENVKELVAINYDIKGLSDTRRKYKEMKFLEPDAFLRKTNMRNNDASDVIVVVDNTGVELLIKNNKAPEYFTSFDDRSMVFDSYDASQYTTLISSNVQAFAYVMPDWEMVDTFIPDLPDEAFIALVEESKSRASAKLKQMSDAYSDEEASRQQRWLSRKAWRVEGGIKYPNYGRRR